MPSVSVTTHHVGRNKRPWKVWDSIPWTYGTKHTLHAWPRSALRRGLQPAFHRSEVTLGERRSEVCIVLDSNSASLSSYLLHVHAVNSPNRGIYTAVTSLAEITSWRSSWYELGKDTTCCTEDEETLLRSKDPATAHHSRRATSSPRPYTPFKINLKITAPYKGEFPNWSLTFRALTKILYAFFTSPLCGTGSVCPKKELEWGTRIRINRQFQQVMRWAIVIASSVLSLTRQPPPLRKSAAVFQALNFSKSADFNCIAEVIPQRFQLQALVTLASIGWCHKSGGCVKSCARRPMWTYQYSSGHVAAAIMWLG